MLKVRNCGNVKCLGGQELIGVKDEVLSVPGKMGTICNMGS